MKKIMILAVVAALVGLSLPQNSSAQESSSPQTPSSTETMDDQGTPATGSGSQGTGTSGSQGTGKQETTGSGTSTGTSGTGTSGTGTSGAASGQQYQEIRSADLPAAVSTSISEKYPGYKTDKAYRGKDGTYKVSVSKGDEKQTLFLDQRGESVKMQK